MISVSKKVVLAVVALVAVLLIGNIVQLVVSDGGDSGSSIETSGSVPSTAASTTTTSVASTTTSNPESATTTSQPSVSSTAAPTPATTTVATTGSSTRTTRTTTTTAAPAPILSFEPLSLAVLFTRVTNGFTFKSTINIDGSKTTGSGSVDQAGDRMSVTVDAGGDDTEIRRSGSALYVNARRLGSSGNTWVSLDTASQSTQLAVKSMQSIAQSLSPNLLLNSLSTAANVELVGTDSTGIHYRATVDKAVAAFAPIIGVIDTAAGSGTATVDVWIESSFRVGRMSTSANGVSVDYTLNGFGDSPTIDLPATGDTGGLDSTSGVFLFGSSQRLAPTSSTNHSVTVQPSVEIVDGIIRGSLHATSATNETLRFSLLSSSAGGKFDIGVVPSGASSVDAQSFTVLPYATWLDSGAGKGSETFDIRVRETTELDQYLSGIPFVGSIAGSVVDHLQDSSAASRVSSIIGVAVTSRINIPTSTLAPADTPVAFTYRITSFDGTKISVNFFPASGLVAGDTAPTALEVAALGKPGVTNPYAVHDQQAWVPGPGTLRVAPFGGVAFNVITWDPRGSYASGGTMQLTHIYYEARDVTAIISWAAADTSTTLDGANDPKVGFVGGSTGGATQIIVGGTDPRVDAIVPASTWNSLTNSLAPNGVVNTTATRSFLAALDAGDVRLSSQVREALVDGINNGRFSEDSLARLSSSGASAMLGQLQAPVLLVQSTADRLFPLTESFTTAMNILDNPFGTPVKFIVTDGDESNSSEMTEIRNNSVAWLQKYIASVPIPDAYQPNLKYWAQGGTHFDSSIYPFDPNFNYPTPIEVTSTGATFQFGSTASGAINLAATINAGETILGSPSLSFTYTGSGTAPAVYARVIDVATGKALGPIATPIPIVLDGQTHTVSVPLLDMVFYSSTGSTINVEIKPSNSSFANSATGHVDISNVVVDFPIRATVG